MNPEAMGNQDVMKEPPQFWIDGSRVMPFDRHEGRSVGVGLMTEKFPEGSNHERSV